MSFCDHMDYLEGIPEDIRRYLLGEAEAETARPEPIGCTEASHEGEVS